jgi:hypothetical protein
LVMKSRFGPGGVVVRKDCFDRVGGFDESLRSAEDRDMWIRLATRYPVGLMEAPLWWYRLHPASMSRNAEKMAHYERAVLDKAFAMPELQGRRRLRRKALGLADYAATLMFRDSGRPWTAAKKIARSFAWWPLPYRVGDVNVPFGRARLVARVLQQLVGARQVPGGVRSAPPPPTAAPADPVPA